MAAPADVSALTELEANSVFAVVEVVDSLSPALSACLPEPQSDMDGQEIFLVEATDPRTRGAATACCGLSDEPKPFDSLPAPPRFDLNVPNRRPDPSVVLDET